MIASGPGSLAFRGGFTGTGSRLAERVASCRAGRFIPSGRTRRVGTIPSCRSCSSLFRSSDRSSPDAAGQITRSQSGRSMVPTGQALRCLSNGSWGVPVCGVRQVVNAGLKVRRLAAEKCGTWGAGERLGSPCAHTAGDTAPGRRAGTACGVAFTCVVASWR